MGGTTSDCAKHNLQLVRKSEGMLRAVSLLWPQSERRKFVQVWANNGAKTFYLCGQRKVVYLMQFFLRSTRLANSPPPGSTA